MNKIRGLFGESGWLYATGKPTIGVTNGDTFKKPINLMPAQAISTWASVKQLDRIDLDNIDTVPYKGALI